MFLNDLAEFKEDKKRQRQYVLQRNMFNVGAIGFGGLATITGLEGINKHLIMNKYQKIEKDKLKNNKTFAIVINKPL